MALSVAREGCVASVPCSSTGKLARQDLLVQFVVASLVVEAGKLVLVVVNFAKMMLGIHCHHQSVGLAEQSAWVACVLVSVRVKNC